MPFRDLVLKNRSYRRFYQDQPVALETLRELIDLARVTPSAANRQPLRYLLSADPRRTRASSRSFPGRATCAIGPAPRKASARRPTSSSCWTPR